MKSSSPEVSTFGWMLSTLWVCVVILWSWQHAEGMANLTPSAFGEFAAGVAAPPAFFWLVIGYWLQRAELEMQREELRMQREEMGRSTAQLEAQAKAISANELHARRDTFMRVADLMLDELNNVAAEIYQKVRGAGPPLMQANWALFSSGDRSVFCRGLLSLSDGGGAAVSYMEQVLNRDDESRERLEGSISRYIVTFDRLIEEAAKCDPDEMLRDTLRVGELGQLCVLLKEVKL